MLRTTSSLFAALLIATPAAAGTLAPDGGPQFARIEAAQAGRAAAPLAAPLAAGGRIFAPGADCRPEIPQGCSLAAYDAGSGAALWHRALDDRPEGPAAPSRAAADTRGVVTWVSPVYDPGTKTLFVGLTAGPADAQPLVTYALDARTGAVEWFRRAAPMSELASASAMPAETEAAF